MLSVHLSSDSTALWAVLSWEREHERLWEHTAVAPSLKARREGCCLVSESSGEV